MTAIQRTRTPYKEDNRAFNIRTLIESSNECEIHQKVDLIMNGTPDPGATGAYKSTVVSFNIATRTLTLSSSTEAAKFKAGDTVILYPLTENFRIDKIKNCVKSVSGSDVELYADIVDIPDGIVIEKNLIFRVSNVNTYRVDEYGIGRSYDAIAGLAEIEASMGEMFEGKWNRSDYSFNIDNYDKKFNDYLPGGSQYTTFALREVNVYLGFGEEYAKNTLLFSGVTNLNNGVSEEDEKLKITAYDISYLYNIPVALNTFSNVISDKDYQGKPIPILFGDYTTYGQYIGGVQRPVIPAVFYRFQTSASKAKLVFNASVFGIKKSMFLDSKTASTTLNDWEIELKYSNEFKATSYLPTCVETSLGGGKYKYSVTLYRGKLADGTLFSSTKWIGYCLLTQANITTNFNVVNGTNEAILYYKNLVLVDRDDDYVGDIYSTRSYFTSGAETGIHAHYKICSNGLNKDLVANFKIWYNNGSYDNISDWETTYNKHGANTLTPLWDCDNGEVVVYHPGSHTEADLLQSRMYVFVAGQKLGATIKTDSDLKMNFANNSSIIASVNGINYVSKDSSGNGAYGEFIGLPDVREGGNFPSNGFIQIQPFMERRINGTVRSCDTFLGVETNCSIERTARYTAEFSAVNYHFNRVDTIESKNFILEVEVQNLTDSLSAFGYRQANSSQRNIAVLGFNDTNKVYVYVDGLSYLYVSYNGQITQASNKPLDGNDIFGVKIVKDTNKIRIYVKNISDSIAYAEVTYASQPTLVGSVGSINQCLIGNASKTPDYNSGGFYGRIGMVRLRTSQTTFQHEPFTVYGVAQDSTDVVSIAKKILEFGGAREDMFDDTFDNFYKAKVSQDYNFRAYIDDPDIKTVDYVVEMMASVGLVLTMKPSNNKMKFSLIWDNLGFYEKSDYRITSYDIELNSVSIDRELNQYFNTANAQFNFSPAGDDLCYSTGDLYEPAAVLRDGNLNLWFKREDKGFGSFEFPNLYIESEVQSVLKYRIANSTPNSEMITMRLSWRHLGLQIGDFVILNHGRYVNVPCQVRSVKIDANGSSLEVKLRSLESVNFIDANKSIEYTPLYFDNVGGIQAVADIISKTDSGDV